MFQEARKSFLDGLTFNKLVVVGLIAAFIIGPERLPALAEGLAKLVKKSKSWLKDSSKNISEEFGDDGVDALEELKKFDPRKFDPRRIIVNAWMEDEQAPGGSSGPGSGPGNSSSPTAGAAGLDIPGAAQQREQLMSGSIATPFDDEAT